MSPETRYTINSPMVIQETMDGEAVIVNLETGTYYSLDNSGGRIWNLLLDGASASEITAMFCRTSTSSRDDIQRAVTDLVEQLCREALLVAANRTPMVSTEDSGGERQPFVPPVLHTYTDMQELLLLDPIHEVDDTTGWPHKKDESTDSSPQQ